MRSIQEIEKDIDACQRSLRELNNELLNTAASNAGLAYGDVVLSKGGRYVFERVYMVWKLRSPWIKARKICKDGSVGKALQTLYDWEKEKP